jgi:hypothetical protein
VILRAIGLRGRAVGTIQAMGDYFWCFEHGRVEEGRTCRAVSRLGPYDTPEAARRWRERVDARNEVWDDEDDRWRGEPDDR